MYKLRLPDSCISNEFTVTASVVLLIACKIATLSPTAGTTPPFQIVVFEAVQSPFATVYLSGNDPNAAVSPNVQAPQNSDILVRLIVFVARSKLIPASVPHPESFNHPTLSKSPSLAAGISESE